MSAQEPNSSLVLRVFSSQLSIEELTVKLQTKPTEYFLAGSSVSPRNPQSPHRKENLWLLESPLGETAPLESHLAFAADFIEEKLALLQSIAPFAAIDIFCSYSQSRSQGGFALTHKVMTSLSKLDVTVRIDFYAMPDGD